MTRTSRWRPWHRTWPRSLVEDHRLTPCTRWRPLLRCQPWDLGHRNLRRPGRGHCEGVLLVGVGVGEVAHRRCLTLAGRRAQWPIGRFLWLTRQPMHG